ncbi:MAG: allophanate hydrolase [Planctomycetota bacterium]|nr:MAG: allophanate hydrolase [Planctomycetota bacterium]
MISSLGWTISQWLSLTLDERREHVQQLLSAIDPHDPMWISCADDRMLEQALAAADPQAPMYGVPFVVKDNIDAAGWVTTAACREFAYMAAEDAAAVAALRASGMILIGKTNMDQFATGLVGTRSPYGAVPNPFNSQYISGGSSSGSAAAVSRGLVPVALGTDTAGSGRVPAACCNIVGLKPSLGQISTHGVVPACRSLDCVSIFALTVHDAACVLQHCQGFDARDPYSQAPRQLPVAMPQRLGIPDEMEWYGDEAAAAAWQESLEHWRQAGATLVPCSFAAMRALALLLYEGPWVAERHAAIREFFTTQREVMNPIVAGIIAKAESFSASDAYSAEYQRQALKRAIHAHFATADALLVPTAPRLPRLDAVAADPVGVNSQLGLWTNFVNLADCCALALPAQMRPDGLPFGVTLIAPAGHDQALAALGSRWTSQQALPLGATGAPWPQLPPLESGSQTSACEHKLLAVVGAHLSGQPLNQQLTERGGRLAETTTTAAAYQLCALAHSSPAKPGMRRLKEGGHAITVELWELSPQAFAELVALVPAPLAIGRVSLADGREVCGFVAQDGALDDAEDISHFGGWREYLAHRNEQG